jgi:hypothetical protein
MTWRLPKRQVGHNQKNGAAMDTKTIQTVRVLKRLKAAIGYHELGMTQHAVRCLDSLSTLGKIGAFSLVAEVLRDEFTNGRNVSAEKALDVVACMLPARARRAVRMTLATCYGPQESGRSANDRSVARGAATVEEAKPTI